MPLTLRVEETRLVAVQTGSLDWQDTDRAFDRCEEILNEHPEVTQLLLDLSEAKLVLTPGEAAELAEIVTLTFSRKIRTAIVSPPQTDACALVSAYAARLRDKGVPVSACETRAKALAYLQNTRKRGACRRCGLAWFLGLLGLRRRASHPGTP